MENPDNSWLWKQEKLRKILGREDLGFWRYDACRYKAPWRKRTKVLLNTQLQGVRELCRGGHKHVILRGRCKEAGLNWTRLAQVYPGRVCSKLAQSVIQRSYASTACAKCKSSRIGEADNPGPSRSRPQRTADIYGMSILEPATDLLRGKLYSAFESWLVDNLGMEACEAVLGCPPLLVEVLQTYGCHLFASGQSQHYYRQLLAHLQRSVSGLRAIMTPAWEVATKWALLKPVNHRPPIPEALLLAMAGLAVGLGWERFVTVLLISFYCAARPGEVLKAERRDALTPQDMLEDSAQGCMYLRIRLPKTRKRGARVQHCKLSQQEIVKFVEKVLQPLKLNCKIFEGSPSSFRRRWDFILERIGVPKKLRITPGSLRGGGAVWCYRAGVPLTDLCWQMRITSIATLGYYLQEVAAESVLAELSSEAVENVKALRDFFRASLHA